MVQRIPNKLNIFYPITKNETWLPFYLTGIGVSTPESHVVREEGLVSHQFLITTEGEGILKIDDKTYTLKAGSCLYLPPHIPHEYKPENHVWKTHWMVFRGRYLSETMVDMGFTDWKITILDDVEFIIRLFNRLQATAVESMYNAEKCSKLIYDFILEYKSKIMHKPSQIDTQKQILEPTIGYMHKKFFKDITLQRLAEISGISMQHLCRVFQKEVGMRPIEYLTKIRIFEAKQLLVHTDEPIALIAEKVGYQSAVYFSSVFKKYENITPNNFRKSKNSVII